MNKAFQNVMTILLSVVIAISLFAGCSSKKESGSTQATGDSTNSGSAQTTGDSTTAGQNATGLPIVDKPVTLTYWVSLSPKVSATTPSYDELPFFKEMEKRTGVKIVFRHPVVGQETEQLNLLVASNELPDLIETNWLLFSGSGGPQKALADNVIIPLNDLIDKNAPNLKALLDSDPELSKQAKTDDGKYYSFPFVRGDEWLRVTTGYVIRKDWLDDLGLKVPVTVDEWYATLKAFKDKKGAVSPLTFFKRPGFLLAGAYGVYSDMYVRDGKVHYGYMDPEYKDFITTLSKWFKEGLLDKDFATINGAGLDAEVTTGKTGVWNGSASKQLGRYLDLMASSDPKFALAGVPYPTLKAGEIPKLGPMSFKFDTSASVAITRACKNQDIAAKWLDYGYSKEGNLLYNYGIEGTSYTMVDGSPKLTDLILKNPDELPADTVFSKYVRSTVGGPFVQIKDVVQQLYVYPAQIDAVNQWANADHSGILPPVTMTSEESKIYSSIYNQIDTYAREMELKFIIGQEPVENFDKFVDQLKKMKADDAVKIRQDALDRYNKR